MGVFLWARYPCTPVSRRLDALHSGSTRREPSRSAKNRALFYVCLCFMFVSLALPPALFYICLSNSTVLCLSVFPSLPPSRPFAFMSVCLSLPPSLPPALSLPPSRPLSLSLLPSRAFSLSPSLYSGITRRESSPPPSRSDTSSSLPSESDSSTSPPSSTPAMLRTDILRAFLRALSCCRGKAGLFIRKQMRRDVREMRRDVRALTAHSHPEGRLPGRQGLGCRVVGVGCGV